MKYTIEDIHDLDKQREACRNEIRATKIRYNSLFRSSIDARIAVLRETALYGSFCKAARELKSGNDESAKKLISILLGINSDDVVELSYKDFITERNHYDDIVAIRFKYTEYPAEYPAVFELRAPNLDSVGFSVNPYKTVDYDFDSFESIMDKLQFSMRKITLSRTGESGHTMTTAFGVDDTFRFKYAFDKALKAAEIRLAKEKENENT